MNNKKPIIAHLENAQISVGLAYKMHAHGAIHNGAILSWENIEKDALHMIKSSANVMRTLGEDPKKKEDEGQTKLDDHTEKNDGGYVDCKE